MNIYAKQLIGTICKAQSCMQQYAKVNNAPELEKYYQILDEMILAVEEREGVEA